jgi:predicted ATP-dependent endonuclease of OLD family
LIDEFESGLHHTVQTDLWRLIIQFANQLDIQVFATTHSWDCVEAFQQASAEDQTEQSLLIRLEKRRDAAGIEAVLYDKRRMEIATREGIEVR